MAVIPHTPDPSALVLHFFFLFPKLRKALKRMRFPRDFFEGDSIDQKVSILVVEK
jgi:hypothetical protein